MLRRLIPPAGPHRFAKKLMAAMRAAGCTDPMEYDAKEFCICVQRGTGVVIWLSNMYGEYRRAPLLARRRLIDHYAQGFSVPAPEIPGAFDEAQANLLPRVAHRNYLERGMRPMPGSRDKPPVIPYRGIADHLGVAAAYDSERCIALISEAQLAEWKVSLEEALAAARDNLWRISNESFREIAPGLFVSPWQDNHDASRLFLHDLVWQLPVQGDHVAMVPHRDVLLVTGSAHVEGLRAMAEFASRFVEDGRFISGLPLRLEGTTWTGYEYPGDDPAARALRELRLKSMTREYAEQQEFLKQRCAEQGDDVHVASVLNVSDPKTGQAWTVCVWCRGCKALLPETDEVGFDLGARSDRPLIVRWADCRRVIGHLMKPQGLWPERYLVEEFPNDSEWAALQEVALKR